MALDQAFRLSSILLAATSCTNLALAITLPPWLLVLAGLAFAGALLRLHPRTHSARLLSALRFSALTWNFFLLSAFAGFWIDLLLISRDVLAAGIHFLLLLLVNKLSNLDHRRDFLHLYAISLIALLASAALTTQIWHAPLFLAYLMAGVWSLLLYHLTKEQEEWTGNPPGHTDSAHLPPPPTSCSRRFFWTANAVAGLMLLLTLLFFFSIPRLGVGLFQNDHEASLRTTGFSDQVDLGVIGPVKLDSSIVMRVELPDRTGEDVVQAPLYLRGVAYDQYNGKSWSNTLPHLRPLTEIPQGVFSVRLPGTKLPAPTGRLRQDILLEPLDTAVLFGAPFIVSVKGNFLSVQADLMGSVQLPFPTHSRLHYTVYSAPTTLMAAEQSPSAFVYPEFVLRHYLQLPSISPSIHELARRITQSSPNIAQSIQRIRTHLTTGYRYSLNVPSLQSDHPLEDFLFARKTGYCEHYATAMVIMLRSAGIPARLVTGFLATEWNAFGSYYTVRQRDAHAWVEVYFPRSGWITMDPTPPAPVPDERAWWETAGSVVDSARLKWDRLFVHYSAYDQRAVIQGIRDGGEAMRTRLSTSVAGLLSTGVTAFTESLKAFARDRVAETVVALLIVLVGLTFTLKWWINRMPGTIGKQDPHSSHQRQAIILYTNMVDCCAHHGIMRQASTTPGEFLRQIQAQWAEAWPSADALTQIYTRARFGRAPLTQDDLSTARRLLHTLQAQRHPAAHAASDSHRR